MSEVQQQNVETNLNNIKEPTNKELLLALHSKMDFISSKLDFLQFQVSNLEGAIIVIDDHRHYGTPLKEALNKFMKRVINSVK